LAPSLAAIRAAERAHEDVQDGATPPMIVGEAVAQPVWNREHTLSDGDVRRQHVIDQVRGALGHQPHNMMRGDLKSAP
jgi:hypothetical protein